MLRPDEADRIGDRLVSEVGSIEVVVQHPEMFERVGGEFPIAAAHSGTASASALSRMFARRPAAGTMSTFTPTI